MPKVLPVRPSLAKKLACDIAAGNAAAMARTRSQMPNIELPLSQRPALRLVAGLRQ
jgi:hypothetical protein